MDRNFYLSIFTSVNGTDERRRINPFKLLNVVDSKHKHVIYNQRLSHVCNQVVVDFLFSFRTFRFRFFTIAFFAIVFKMENDLTLFTGVCVYSVACSLPASYGFSSRVLRCPSTHLRGCE